jgi:uncharacterized protein YjaZ
MQLDIDSISQRLQRLQPLVVKITVAFLYMLSSVYQTHNVQALIYHHHHNLDFSAIMFAEFGRLSILSLVI